MKRTRSPAAPATAGGGDDATDEGEWTEVEEEEYIVVRLPGLPGTVNLDKAKVAFPDGIPEPTGEPARPPAPTRLLLNDALHLSGHFSDFIGTCVVTRLGRTESIETVPPRDPEALAPTLEGTPSAMTVEMTRTCVRHDISEVIIPTRVLTAHTDAEATLRELRRYAPEDAVPPPAQLVKRVMATSLKRRRNTTDRVSVAVREHRKLTK